MTKVSPIIAVFGQSAEGHLAAQVDDLAWLALPAKAGLKMASAWRLAKDMADWVAGDFYGADGIVPDEAAFRAHVEAIAQHKRELVDLPRPEITCHAHTPWGMTQQCYHYAEGILCHATASHGGFHLDEVRNALVHETLRNEGGWYEEDGEWAKIAFSFPALFTSRERDCADRTLCNHYPDFWEAAHGVTLAPGESRAKDAAAFARDHAEDWVVVSAIRSDRHPGKIECVATIGGNRARHTVRHFLVPADEYQPGAFGFVIDETRHVALPPSMT